MTAGAGSGRTSLTEQVERLLDRPVTDVVRVNVVGLDLVRGAGLLLLVVSAAWSVLARTPWIVLWTWVVTLVLEVLVWLVLRRRAGPVRFGLTGGVLAVDQGTLWVLGNRWWSQSPVRVLGSWPRPDVELTEVRQRRSRRLFTLTFGAGGPPCRVEALGPGGDLVLERILGPGD